MTKIDDFSQKYYSLYSTSFSLHQNEAVHMKLNTENKSFITNTLKNFTYTIYSVENFLYELSKRFNL